MSHYSGLFVIEIYTLYIKGNQQIEMSLVVRKPVFGASDQVQHKPGCTVNSDS